MRGKIDSCSVFLCALVGLGFLLPPAQAATYLVLPFFNVSKNPNLDWIGESLADSVREALSSEGLMALNRDDRIEAYSRLSLRPYALLTKASVVKIGEELDAEQVIFGQYDVKAGAGPCHQKPGFAADHGARAGPEARQARPRVPRSGRPGRSGGAAGAPGLADVALS